MSVSEVFPGVGRTTGKPLGRATRQERLPCVLLLPALPASWFMSKGKSSAVIARHRISDRGAAEAAAIDWRDHGMNCLLERMYRRGCQYVTAVTQHSDCFSSSLERET